MRVLGVNKGVTLSGKALRNGGAAIYDDGKLVALAEERSTGTKYAGGYDTALHRLLDSTGLDLDVDFDQLVVSTCCESIDSAMLGHLLEGHEKLLAVGHHISHASLAFYASGFEDALVAVVDGGGNTLARGAGPTPEWWREKREQASYYLATRARGLELVDVDFLEPYEVGLAEMYRAFTYFLGWHSSVHASKTMALAGHGDRSAIAAKLFEFDGEHLTAPIKNLPADPIGMISDLGQALGANFGEPRRPNQAILRIHRDVAAFVQYGIEEALRVRLAQLKRQLKIERLCLGGGLALNVVVNGKLLDMFPGGVYVPSAPADDGQCLGNVFAGLDRLGVELRALRMRTSLSAEIGPAAKIDSAAVADGLKTMDLASYVVFETTDFSELVAKFIASGSVVCVYQSRSEFGPRALGSRSILADPRRTDVTSELNTMKRREWFMPFAPAVLRQKMSQWFRPTCESPFMSFAVHALEDTTTRHSAVANVDGTSRVQTVDPESDKIIGGILSSFRAHTNVPFVVNTSFNLGGDPIVETIPQALKAFSQMPVNVLAIGRFVVVKSISPTAADLPLEGSIKELELTVRRGGAAAAIDTTDRSVAAVIRQLQYSTNSVVFVRTELPLFGPYLDWLRQGRKVTTIRFRRNAVEIPFSDRLPLFETPDYGPGDRSRPTEYVQIRGVRYHQFGELDVNDAERDGFDGLDHMRKELHEIYPALSDEDWVTVYQISITK